MIPKHSLMVLFFLLFVCTLNADTNLEEGQILEILQKLTNQNKTAWIPAGTIKAVHQEYEAAEITDPNKIKAAINQKVQDYQAATDKRELTSRMQKMKLDAIPFNVRYGLSNEYEMTSNVTLKYNGEKFYWQISVDSRSDSVKKPAKLSGNFMTNEFDIKGNKNRIFVWDGQEYTMYSPSRKYAIVDAEGRSPHPVNGPLTAGVIPWGYGKLTYSKLQAASLQGQQRYIDNREVVELTIETEDGLNISAVLYPQKDYVPKSYSISSIDGSSYIYREYSDYRFIDGNWIPRNIFIGEYEKGTDKLLSRDIWDIQSIDCNVPMDYEFDVEYEQDTSVEYFSGINDNSEKYHYSADTDTEQLLTDRLLFSVAGEDAGAQNCATAALKYVGSEFGENFDYKSLSQLIEQPGKQTSLEAAKDYLESRGLYCRAVKTSLDQLKNLTDCEVILYLSSREHFVVLDKIDNQSVWTIDLSEDKFYYPTDIAYFDMDWSGAALLVSDNYIDGEFKEIPVTELDDIKGGSGYSCTNLLQNYYVVYCDYLAGDCMGIYETHYERWGCEQAESGSCSSGIFIRYRTSPCINHLEYPEGCTVTGEWTFYYIRACE